MLGTNSRLNFAYDRSDQPVAMSGIASGSFAYDAHNRRVKQTINGETIYSVYGLDGTLRYRDNITTGEVTDYIRLGQSGRTIVRLTTSGGSTSTTFVHNDHLGSSASATNVAGNLLWRESYTPFGETLNNPAANANNQGYTGHIQDTASGLTYMQARYYDPVIGRFHSSDPVGFGSGGPGYFNRYAYTFNAPSNFIDPTGMCTGSRIKDNDGNCKSTGGKTTGLGGSLEGMAMLRVGGSSDGSAADAASGDTYTSYLQYFIEEGPLSEEEMIETYPIEYLLALEYDISRVDGSPINTSYGGARSWIEEFYNYSMGRAQRIAINDLRSFTDRLQGTEFNTYLNASRAAGSMASLFQLNTALQIAARGRYAGEALAISRLGPEYFGEQAPCAIYGQSILGC